MSPNSQSPFEQHDRDRVALKAAIAVLNAASVYGPAPSRLFDLGLRLFYVKDDVLALVEVLLDLDAAVRPWAEMLENAATPPQARLKQFIAASPEAIPSINRLAVTYKALHFFLRALQDLAYAILLELLDQRSSYHTSMARCFVPAKNNRHSNNPVRSLIAAHVPEYERWFKRFRDQRNEFKLGRGHGLSTNRGRIFVSISLQQGRTSHTVALLGISDVIEGLEMSTALFTLMKQLCQTQSTAA